MFLRSLLLALAAVAAVPGAARAAESYDSCTGFIDSLPATISSEGTWCLRRDLATAISTGMAITVAADNVAIDCNDYKLGNLAAGKGTAAVGVYSAGSARVQVRHCNIRGFLFGILLDSAGAGKRHRIEDNSIEGATHVGIELRYADGSLVRGNLVSGVGGSTLEPGFFAGIHTTGSIDILDNTVVKVTGAERASGIEAYQNDSGSISHNRVRDILAGNGGSIAAIDVGDSRRLSLRGNDITTTHGAVPAGGHVGLVCGNTSNRARRNAVGGFPQGIVGCGDAGGNDVTP